MKIRSELAKLKMYIDCMEQYLGCIKNLHGEITAAMMVPDTPDNGRDMAPGLEILLLNGTSEETDPVRRSFELNMSNRGVDLTRDEHGEYSNPTTQLAWKGGDVQTEYGYGWSKTGFKEIYAEKPPSTDTGGTIVIPIPRK